MAMHRFAVKPVPDETPAPAFLTPAQRDAYAAAMPQVEAIFALEGFEPDEQSRAIDAAVTAGRVGPEQLRQELIAYARENKTLRGFIESRAWAA